MRRYDQNMSRCGQTHSCFFAVRITGGLNFFRKLAKKWRTRRIFFVPVISMSVVLGLGVIARGDCAGAWMILTTHIP
jgi:hypothetical protein